MASISCPKCKAPVAPTHDIGYKDGKVCKWCWETWMRYQGREDELPKKPQYVPMDNKLFDNVRRKK